MGTFKFSVVNAGQRNVNVEPALIATSTNGGFRLTGPAAKALGIKPTDYAMFLHDSESNTWAIAKGYACKKADGEYQTCTDRVDRKAIVARNFDSILEAALASGNDELIAALNAEGVTKEAQIELLAPCVEVPMVTKYQGSKTASPSGLTGEGANVVFTDSNVWEQLKSDVEDKKAMTRSFALDLNDLLDVEVFDGHDNITVKALVLGEYHDDVPMRRA
jgi:hypothetical protein